MTESHVFSANRDAEPETPDPDVSEAAMIRLRSPFDPTPATPSRPADGPDRSR